MTHPLSRAAVEAAAKAIYAKTWAPNAVRWKDKWSDREHDKQDKDVAFEQAEAALSAAFEQARAEGNIRDGRGVIFKEMGNFSIEGKILEPSELDGAWICDTASKEIPGAFPVLIIRKPT